MTLGKPCQASYWAPRASHPSGDSEIKVSVRVLSVNGVQSGAKRSNSGSTDSQRLLALSWLQLSGLCGGIGLRTRRSGVRISQGAPFFSRGYQEIPNLSFGCNGCNWQFRCHCGHVETKASLLRCESAELNIFLHFRVAICDALVRVSNPEPQQVFRHSAFSKMRHAKAPERMKPARLPANFLQDRMQAPSQHIRLMQRSSCRGFENEAFRSARYVIV